MRLAGCRKSYKNIMVSSYRRVPYGLLPSTVRAITEYHAGQIYQAEERITDQHKADGCKILIGEIDGRMIPIVKVDEEAEDKRKNKTLKWREARLCLELIHK